MLTDLTVVTYIERGSRMSVEVGIEFVRKLYKIESEMKKDGISFQVNYHFACYKIETSNVQLRTLKNIGLR